MLSGHVQGRFLSMISHMISPKSVLEIGTFTGYSAICIAEGLRKDGILHTIEINEELEQENLEKFNKSGFGDKIIQHIGNALEIIPQLGIQFDLVFLDADKVNYPHYFDLILNHMNIGGFLLADNVLWGGKVVHKPEQDDKDTKAIVEFNDKVQKDNRVENVMLPFRDGVSLIRKIG